MANEPCNHDGDHTFGYLDFNDYNWKWHCDACKSTLSGPQPRLAQVRAAIEAMTVQAEKFFEQAGLSTRAMRETFARIALHQNKLIDILRHEIKEGAFAEENEKEMRAERVANYYESMEGESAC